MPSRILVVDDDARVARSLTGVLTHHGYELVRAESGEAALEHLGLTGFDLVLLDARLPGISGFRTCERIRELYGPALPVLMLTGDPDQKLMREGYEAGADDFLLKPVDISHLVLKVKACLRFKSMHDEMNGHREVAQARARDLARLHEIGRDWSLIAEPAEFHAMVTSRLAALIGAPICLLALYDPPSRTVAAALPAHGLPDEIARKVRYVVRPEYRSWWNLSSGRPYVSNRARTDPRLVPEMVGLMDAESVVLVPMMSEGEVLGIIAALNKPGGFTDADVPDQMSRNGSAALQWQLGKFQVGYRHALSNQDNRQIGREDSDLNTTSNAVTFGFIAGQRFNASVDLSLDQNENEQEGRRDRTQRYGTTVNWTLFGQTALGATLSTTSADNNFRTLDQQGTIGFLELSSGFALSKRAATNRQGRVFVRYSEQQDRSRDSQFGFDSDRRGTTIASGLTLSVH